MGVEGSVIAVLEQNIAGSPVPEGQYDVRYLTAGSGPRQPRAFDLNLPQVRFAP